MAGLVYKNSNSQQVSLSGTAYVNPTHGTMRLCVKTGSASNAVNKYGLTSNSSASQYCGLRMKVSNGVAYIGRSESAISTVKTSSSTTIQTSASASSSTTSLQTATSQSTNTYATNSTRSYATSSLRTYTTSVAKTNTALVSTSGAGVKFTRTANVSATKSSTVLGKYTSGWTQAASTFANSGNVGATASGVNGLYSCTTYASYWSGTSRAVNKTACASRTYKSTTATSTRYTVTRYRMVTYFGSNKTAYLSSSYTIRFGTKAFSQMLTGTLTYKSTSYAGIYSTASAQNYSSTVKSTTYRTSKIEVKRNYGSTQATSNMSVSSRTYSTKSMWSTAGKYTTATYIVNRTKNYTSTAAASVTTRAKQASAYYYYTTPKTSYYNYSTTWKFTRTVYRTLFYHSFTTSATASAATNRTSTVNYNTTSTSYYNATSTSTWNVSVTKTITGTKSVTASQGSTNSNYTYTQSYLTHNFNL